MGSRRSCEWLDNTTLLYCCYLVPGMRAGYFFLLIMALPNVRRLIYDFCFQNKQLKYL